MLRCRSTQLANLEEDCYHRHATNLYVCVIDSGPPGSAKKCLACAVASFGQSAVSAFATIIPFLEDEYTVQEGKNDQDMLNLSVMPTLTQGLSNLALVPLALAIGRRPVYLGANVIFLLACILAANCTSYNQHLVYRLMMGCSVGVGQSLVPLMVKESVFLHQRATFLSWSGTINSIFGLVWGMFVPNVVGQVGWRNLYYIVSFSVDILLGFCLY